jgi:hypothetical protein
MSRGRALLLFALLLAVGLVLPALPALEGLPDREVRSLPRLTHAGRIGRESALGQVFRCEADGLRAVDLALARLPGERRPLELVLRADGPGGEVLRRATATPEGSRLWLAFEFEPLEDSGGRWLHLAVRPLEGEGPSTYTPWIRYHGQVGLNAPWGDRVLVTPRTTTEFVSPLDHLRALALAFEQLAPVEGPVTLRLREAEAPRRVVREVRLEAARRVRVGYVFLAFEPLPESAGRRYVLELEAGAPLRLVANEAGPSFKTFHGTPGSRPGMRGATAGDLALGDRDLVFRARAGGGRLAGLRLLAQRLGGRGVVALAAWVLATLALTACLAGRGQSPDGGSSS